MATFDIGLWDNGSSAFDVALVGTSPDATISAELLQATASVGQTGWGGPVFPSVIVSTSATPAPTLAASSTVIIAAQAASVVSTTAAAGTNGTASITSPSIAVLTGDVVIVCTNAINTGLSSGITTDSQGNSHITTCQVTNAAAGGYAAVSRVQMSSSGNATFTHTMSGDTANFSMIVIVTRGTDVATVDVANRTASAVSSTTPSRTTGSVAAGNIVIGFVSIAGPTTDTFTDDTDTTNGAWSASTKSTSGGTTATASTSQVQTKLTTGAGTQTYDPTLGTSRFWVDWDIIVPAIPVSGIGVVTSTVAIPDAHPPILAAAVSAVAAISLPSSIGDPNASIDLRASAAFAYINRVGVADVGGYVSTYVPSGTAVGDLLIAVYSGSLGSNLATWASIGSTGFRYKVATGTDLTTLFDATDEISSAVIGIWTFRNQGASPIETSALGSTSAGPYVAPSVTAASASDVWLVLLGLNNGSANVSSGFTSDGFVGGDIVSTYGIFHKQLTASGATGTASFTSNGGYNGNASSVIVTSGGVGGLDIKVAAAASIPTPTVSANSTVPASLVTAVTAIPNAHPPISAVVLLSVATIALPTVVTQTDASITAALVTAVAAVTTERPAVATARVIATAGITGSVVSPGPATVLATAAITTERPAIAATKVSAVAAIAQPQSPATVTAAVVTAVGAVIRPALGVPVTGLTATAATATLTGYAAGASSTVTAPVTSSMAAAPAAAVHLYKMGAYKPNILYTLTNLTGSYTDIQDSPDTPDANALVPTGGAIVVRMGFENHTQDMRTQAGDQKFRVVVKVP